MRKNLLHCLLCISAALFLSLSSQAQSRLIYYWDFNGTSGTYHLPTIPAFNADYNIGTATGVMQWQPSTTVSSGYASYCDISAAATADFDTVNTLIGAPTGNYFRARNPSDSMELLFYIPSTNYQNITIRYGTETSSLTSGDSAQIYSYSLDSGVTWNTVGLSTPAAVLNTATWDTFRAAQVTITDPAANNNPKLVFRIITMGRNHTTSGNNRFDNISVKGDTISPVAIGTLIHFWDFNTFSGTYNNPSFPRIAPDYTIHPAANAYVHFGLFPGTSLSNPTYFDAVAEAFGTADYDTVNDFWPVVSGTVIPSANGIRMRNPDDSTYLYYYMPTTNYKNINLIYGSETSSYTSGDSLQVFNYSVDSGVTWNLAGISEPYDSASLTFRRIHVSFTDPAANNCATLFFRLHLLGRNTGTSGNNRFDNISVQGDSILSPMATITTTPAAYGPYCNTVSSPLSVAFTTTGPLGQLFSVQISNANGTFPTNFTSNLIGSGASSPIAATIPAGYTPGNVYRIRVVSSYPGIYGSDNGTNIALAGVAGPISGPSSVCVGSMASLIESGSGTWYSSNTANATIGSTTGVVTGVSQGTSQITFSVGPGCNAYLNMTVNPLPVAIGGTFNACPGTTASLSDLSGSGTWSSTLTGVATVGSSSGVVTGVVAGTSLISYILSTGCFTTQSVTINPLPANITGSTIVCQGSNTTLSDLTAGGTWSSSNTGLATVGTSGIVTGVAGGLPVITYALPTGCIATSTITVNPTPSAIVGSANGCIGVNSNLSDLTAFGEWTSSNTAVATIGSSTGVLTGIAIGSATISYILSTGCLTTKTIAVNTLPNSITGTAVFCAGSTTTLSDLSAGGTWSSSNTAIATVGTGGLVTSFTGLGGNPVITYTLPTGCSAYYTLSVNASPGPIAGPSNLYCFGTSSTLSDAGSGTWSSSNTGVATIGSSSGIVTGVTAGFSNITYTLPGGCYTTMVETVNAGAAPITGPDSVCAGTTTNYTDGTAYGAWSSSNSTVASIGSGSGILNGVAPGTAVITYGLSSVCTTTSTITINPIPTSITGTTNVCIGLSTPLMDAAGGKWTSSDSYLATVGSSSGIVTGLVASILTITYSTPLGCYTTSSFTVNPNPVAITGTMHVCMGLTTTLSNTTPGGSWSSSNANATIDPALGTVTGVTAGTAIMTYQLPTGCLSTVVFTVNPLPMTITGSSSVCMALTTTLGDPSTGGTWSTSDNTIATVTTSTGILTGVYQGTVMVTYTLPTSCITTETFTVNPRFPILGGTTFCVGLTNYLSDPATGGTWMSSNTTVATVGSSSGVLTGLIPGTSIITYSLPTGCTETEVATIISLPAPISGGSQVCLGLSTLLTDGGGGGWYSSDPTIAYIGFGTGIVNGIAPGTVTITYSLGTSCTSTEVFTVNPLPSIITGLTTACAGLSFTLADSASGGSWTSSNTSVLTIDPVLGTATGVSAGNVNVTYTLPTGCIMTTSLSVNPLSPVTGTMNVCAGLTTTLADATSGGTFSSSDITLATIDPLLGIATGITAGTPLISYNMPSGCTWVTTLTVNPLPASITGMASVCLGSSVTLADSTPAGSWSSSNTAVATIDMVAGMITSISAGTTNITYTLSTGCIMVTPFTVNPVSPVTGPSQVCTGVGITLADTTAGGTWSSSLPGTASVDMLTGIVTGMSAGTATISYILPTGCTSTASVLVLTSPASITGVAQVCQGLTSTLADTTSGGVWSSPGTGAIAAVDSTTGVVAGLTGGTLIITYTITNGCIATSVFTVNALAAITGTTHVCTSFTTTLSDTAFGGSWYSSASGIATVGSSTGIVTGITGGTAIISYILPSGCFALADYTVNILPTEYTITGGGSYCSGGTGVHVGLSSSTFGIDYQLFNGTTMIGTPLAGIGTVLDFGLETGAGSYTILATNPVTGCSQEMASYVVVNEILSVTPSVVLTSSTRDSICSGTITTFTAIPVNGGSLPVFSWTVNRAAAGMDSISYTYTPANNDTVAIMMVSNATCATVDTVMSYVIMTVTPNELPTVNISSSRGDTLCAGTPVIITATPAFGGTSPVYTWYLNSVLVDSGSTYAVIPTDSNNIVVTMTSNYPCSISSTVSSNDILMHVFPNYLPSVVISAVPGNYIYTGESVTFNTTVTDGGPTPLYQWLKNGAIITGATSASFTSSTLSNLDSISCVVKGTGVCGDFTFNSIIMHVATAGVAPLSNQSDITIFPNPNKGSFTLKGSLGTTSNTEATMEIMDLPGQVIYSSKVAVINGNINEQVQLSNTLASGMYIINLHTESGNIVFHMTIE